MISPGNDVNFLPTSSGTMSNGVPTMANGNGGGLLGTSIFKLNGFTLTIGLVLLVAAMWILYGMFFTGRRRR